MYNKLIDYFSYRPYVSIFSIFLAGGGGISALLAWMKMITPILGFVGALTGAIAGTLAVCIKIKEWRNLSK